MTRSEIVQIYLDVLNRRPSDWEYQQLNRAITALRAKPDDVIVRMMVIDFHMLDRLRSVLEPDSALAQRRVFFRRHQNWFLGWSAVALIAILIIGTAVGVATEASGYRRAMSDRWDIVTKEHAWTQTPSGRAAKALSDAGLSERLARCDFPAWRWSDRFCTIAVDARTNQRLGYPLQEPFVE